MRSLILNPPPTRVTYKGVSRRDNQWDHKDEDRLDPLGTLVPQVLFPLLDFVENWEVGEEASDSELEKVGEAGLDQFYNLECQPKD